MARRTRGRSFLTGCHANFAPRCIQIRQDRNQKSEKCKWHEKKVRAGCRNPRTQTNRVSRNARGDPPHRRNTTLMADRRLSKRANIDVRCYLGNTQMSLSPTSWSHCWYRSYRFENPSSILIENAMAWCRLTWLTACMCQPYRRYEVYKRGWRARCLLRASVRTYTHLTLLV